MKLLIDIPEHIYEHAKEESEDSIDEGKAMRAIANGSPTRCKGMNEAEKERLIKKDIRSIENRVRSAFNQGYEMGLKESRSEKPNTCGDAISRQAIEEIKEIMTDISGNSVYVARMSDIRTLPSVTPQQRTGQWIEESKFMMINLEDARKQYTDLGYPHRNELVLRCTACNKSSIVDETIVYNYCPHCGAKMEEEE